jgi:hypothetical protein
VSILEDGDFALLAEAARSEGLGKEVLRQRIISGAAGILWIPKVGESKIDFQARAATGSKGGFNHELWAREHESALKKKLPDNFKGEGW